MKNASEYARRVKQLYSKLKKDGSKASLSSADDCMQILLIGIFSNYATEQKAASAVDRLLEAVVDLNDLRVTPVADVVEFVGSDFPSCRRAATEISQFLNALFNATHALDLSFLKGMSKKSADTFLKTLDGLGAHAKAFLARRYLNTHAIPLDSNMFDYLQRTEAIHPTAGVEEAQKFLAGQLKEKDASQFYMLFKRFAATHASRKGARKTTKKTAKASTKKTTSKKKAAAKKKTTSKKKTAAKKKTTSKKKVTSKKKKTAAKKKTTKSRAGKKTTASRKKKTARKKR